MSGATELGSLPVLVVSLVALGLGDIVPVGPCEYWPARSRCWDSC
jgi:hypothetical protein